MAPGSVICDFTALCSDVAVFANSSLHNPSTSLSTPESSKVCANMSALEDAISCDSANLNGRESANQRMGGAVAK